MPDTKEILIDFIREVWSEGKLDASDRYLAALRGRSTGPSRVA